MLLLLLACTPKPAADTAWWPPCTDVDGDYYCVEDGDCDDASADVNPGVWECELPENGSDDDCNGVVDECSCWDPTVTRDAAEVCDGNDNNCNGEIDEGVGTTWYPRRGRGRVRRPRSDDERV